MWQIILDVFLDALIDSLKIFPFLLVMHILIEVYEHNAGSKLKVSKLLNGKAAPLLGAGVGLIPQCGFSVVSTKLYANKNIKLGTLLAVYIATSDEAVPILLSDPSTAIKLVPLLLIKFSLALIAGYTVNFFLRKETAVTVKEDALCECGNDCHGHTALKKGKSVKGLHGHKIDEAGRTSSQKDKFDWDKFVFHPIIHSLTILGFIFAVNLVLGAVIEFVGQERFEIFMGQATYAQVPLSALIGFIPNCASSVVITQLYALGSLSLGACVAGLSVNAGIAFAVLFKENKNLKANILIMAGLYIFSVISGLLIVLIETGISAV